MCGNDYCCSNFQWIPINALPAFMARPAIGAHKLLPISKQKVRAELFKAFIASLLLLQCFSLPSLLCTRSTYITLHAF